MVSSLPVILFDTKWQFKLLWTHLLLIVAVWVANTETLVVIFNKHSYTQTPHKFSIFSPTWKTHASLNGPKMLTKLHEQAACLLFFYLMKIFIFYYLSTHKIRWDSFLMPPINKKNVLAVWKILWLPCVICNRWG